MTVNNTVEPRDSWSSIATLVYASLPDENGTNDDVPGAYGSSNGARNGADGNGGALNDYAPPATSSATLTVASPTVSKQVEHPLNTPIASTVFAAYSDSTSDSNTGTSLHDSSNVDIAIGETFSYIVTVTFPEGTTNGFVLLDTTNPTQLSGGRQFRVIDLMSAELLYVGANLSGVGIPAVGSTFTATDSNADGDADFLRIPGSGSISVLNTPDNISSDADRLVLRVFARLDDEDASGGAADDLAGVDNNNGEFAGNLSQITWTDNVGSTNLNAVEDIDIVEPTLTLTKTASVAGAGQGDTVAFTLTLANTGTAPAYDVVFTDTLPFLGATNYFTFSSINTASSTCDNRTGYSATTGTPISSFDFDNLLVGESCTLVINAVVQNTTTLNTTYTNNASITSYSSRPATPADDRTYPAVNASANVLVLDRITIAFDTGSSSAAEATGIGNVLRITTASGNATSAAASVTISVTGGSATAADYTLGGTITIPVGTANNSLVSIASGFSVTNELIVEPDETVNLQISAPSSNAVLGAQTTHTHTIQNDDSTTLTINDNNLIEGNSGTSTLNLTVTSSAAVQGGFTVAYSLSDATATIADNDYAATGSSLSFTGTSGETRTIAVTINGDANLEADETFTASLGAISGTSIAAASFNTSDTGTGTIINDDSATITVSPITVAITEGGATANFNVTAQANPTSPVSIPVTTDAACTVSVNPIILPAGTTSPVSVTVTAVDDLDIEGPHTCAISLGDPTSADTNFDVLTAADTADVTANITDDDFAGITVSPATVAITEGGATVGFDVSTNNNTTATVDVSITTDGQCLISTLASPVPASTLIVTLPAGSGTAITVTVEALDDNFAEGAHNCIISTGDPISTDTNYDVLTAVDVADVTANVTDNDTPGIALAPITVTEGLVGLDMSVTLSSEPTGDVTITLSSDTQCSLSATTLTFTGSLGATPWNAAQPINVTAVDDSFAEGLHLCVITYSATSTDTNYTIASTTHNVDVVDNDTPGVALSAITITEGLIGLDMDLALFTQPTGDVTITLSSDAQCTLSVTSLTFTDSAGASPWNVAQLINVTAVDDTFAEGAHICVITYSATSTDANYTIASTTHDVDVVDNDTPGVLVAVTSGSNQISENGANDTVDISLATEPTANVTLTLTTNGQCTVSPATLNFTDSAGASPWNTPQTVTITAINDSDVEGLHRCFVTYTASSADTNYDLLRARIRVNVVDNDRSASSAVLEPQIGIFDPAISKLGLLVPGQLGVTGERLEWFVTVTNNGLVAGTNVIVSDTLRSELTIIGVEFVTGNGVSVITGQTVTVSIASLAPNQSVVFKIITDVSAGVSVDNTACVSASNLSTARCITALPVESLPSTGETPHWLPWLLSLIGELTLTMSLALWRSYRKTS